MADKFMQHNGIEIGYFAKRKSQFLSELEKGVKSTNVKATVQPKKKTQKTNNKTDVKTDAKKEPVTPKYTERPDPKKDPKGWAEFMKQKREEKANA